jgi:two-component system phosphate regulon response regulator OmpR
LHKRNIVICEDDAFLGPTLNNFLSDLGYNVILTTCSEELDQVCSAISPDALILDRQLPGEWGPEIAQRYHANSPEVPIIMMSIDDSVESQVDGYNKGAMIYLPKPFQPVALEAALRGIFSNKSITENFKNLQISDENELILESGTHVSLNRKESAILRLMTLRKPKLVETYELLELLTDSDGELPPKSAVEVLISRLRKKLKDNGIEREMLQIKSEHGLGYSIQGRISIKS